MLLSVKRSGLPHCLWKDGLYTSLLYDDDDDDDDDGNDVYAPVNHVKMREGEAVQYKSRVPPYLKAMITVYQGETQHQPRSLCLTSNGARHS